MSWNPASWLDWRSQQDQDEEESRVESPRVDMGPRHDSKFDRLQYLLWERKIWAEIGGLVMEGKRGSLKAFHIISGTNPDALQEALALAKKLMPEYNWRLQLCTSRH